jgi:tetratricopeptide (TPR) repeat protein
MTNLSLAINYSLGGTDVRGYHAGNLVIHLLAGLTLFGIMRRSFLQPRLPGQFGAWALPLALATTVIWVVHPLQTEAVTYIVQRAESIVGLFYLLTLYCAIRGAESPQPGIWYVLSVASCAMGMASKEVMASAPLVVLLYDRTLISQSFEEAFRRRWRLYASLSATWVLLGYLMVSGSIIYSSNASIGRYSDSMSVTWWEYLLTQPAVILHYLKLTVWPRTLCLDYGWPPAKTWTSIVPALLVIAVLLGATCRAIKKNSVLGFLGAWFFLILAPSSSFFPLRELAFEHRMYLPLAAIVVLVITVGSRILVSLARRIGARESDVSGIAYALVSVIVLTLGCLTARRNEDYRTTISIWSDTARKEPRNPRAFNNLGTELDREGRVQEAIACFEQAVQLQPGWARAHNNLGNVLLGAGRPQEAIGQYEEVLRLQPDWVETRNNMGTALLRDGRVHEAMAQWQQTLRLNPDYAEGHNNLAITLAQTGNLEDAILHWQQAVRIKPDFLEAHFNLGIALEQTSKIKEAITQYEETVRLNPDFAQAKENLARLRAAK